MPSAITWMCAKCLAMAMMALTIAKSLESVSEVADEAAVDFQRIDPPVLEVAQARIANSPEIIDGDLDSKVA